MTEAMCYKIILVIPITPVEAIHILDNSPHCWILMVSIGKYILTLFEDVGNR